MMNICRYSPQIDGVLYDPGEKMGTRYSDLELGNEFWSQDRIPVSGHKSLE